MKQILLIICLANFTALCHAEKISFDSVTTNIPMEPEIFDRAEVMPTFPGGFPQLLKFLSNNIKYPSEARQKGLEGKVIIKFYVDTDGGVKQSVVLKDGVGGGAAEEAMRVIGTMPKWIPGSQRGIPVKVYFTLPVSFKLYGTAMDSSGTSSGVPNAVTGLMDPIIKPSFVGGDGALTKFKDDLVKSLVKVKEEQNKKIVVNVSFLIDELGKISSVEIFEKNTNDQKNLSKIKEAVTKMPPWVPAQYKRKPIASSAVLTLEY